MVRATPLGFWLKDHPVPGFRAAPAQRLIPVFGRLSSNWPVAGGVVAKDGVVYAAAGITDYDDTTLFYNHTMDSEGFFLHSGAPKPLSRWKSFTMQPRKVTGERVWERQDLSRLRSIILAGDRLLVTGDGQTCPFAAALRAKDGKSIWQVALKAPTVKHGVAVGRDGRTLISLENGEVACLAP